MNEELLLSQLSLTRRSSSLPKLIKVNSTTDLSKLRGMARYEFSRGIDGNEILDLTSLRGVEDLGDKIKVLSGTPWRDVIKYNPETYGNLDFSVGGSVFFGDAGFGFNEFGLIKDRVEVEGYLNGIKYTGKYNGGIIYAVYIKKESKQLAYKGYTSDDIDAVLYKLKNWFTLGFPAFRDITINIQGGLAKLIVSYPSIREQLLLMYVSDLQKVDPIYEDLTPRHKYQYFGTTDLNGLFQIKENIKRSERTILRFRGTRVYFTIYSNTPLKFAENTPLTAYSDSDGQNDLNGCVLCGRCVDVCPYGEMMGSPVYTPLGLYVLQPLGFAEGLVNCHMCGKCVEVCPSKLDILTDLRKYARYDKIDFALPEIRELPASSVIVLTPISKGLEDRAIRALLYLHSKGKKVGIIRLDINVIDLLLDRADWTAVAKKLENVNEIITITPEEYHYLQALKRLKILDINFVEELVLPDTEIEGKELHIPCMIGIRTENDELNKCSLAFLQSISNKSVESKVSAKYTLCPITAKKLNIKTPLDTIFPTLNLQALENTISKLHQGEEDTELVVDDAKWYEGIAEELFIKVNERTLSAQLNRFTKEEMLLLYFYMDKFESLSDKDKEIITKEITKLFSS
ncbi:4Fe-4S dicluster domain-containing protein [Stygiolobus caldivivus]|uniref:4Fe-4S ferredoxin-type domain-containing protein n=1 Tax=Stygiolobus caldivivus TaxID=2824673 RepID=A0A8D5ZIN3_9CREN|nr:4Fe-4S dicluster domain-containing protein [Stygiolobus caldivivus]BCU69422.1 hypothetical protein KN1_07190 [Stygiolobus caldivivus]